MARCEWCGTPGELIMHKDIFGDIHYICEKCNTNFVKEHKCRKCKNTSEILINGLCENCIQGVLSVEQKKKEEAISGVGAESISVGKGGIDLTDETYEKWLMTSKAFSPEDFKKNRQLRFIWIMVKLMAVGISDNEIISKRFDSIEKLIDRNFTKLKGNKCTLIIAYTPELRKFVKTGDIIDSEDDIYILSGL